MKQFFKYVLATVVGILCIGVLWSMMAFVMLGVVAASSETEPQVEEGTVLRIKLKGTLQERATDNPFASILGKDELTTQGLDDLIHAVKVAKDNEKVKGIYLESGILASDVASLQELRKALLDFKQSKKFIIAYGDQYEQSSYYLASVADKVYLNPSGMINWHGLAMQPIFFTDLMAKVGVKMQVFKVGTYKSAVEPFILTQMSDANREQVTAFVGDMWGEMVKDVAASRRLKADSLNAYADRYAVFAPAQDYLRMQLADSLTYIDGVRDKLRALSGKDKVKFVEAAELAKLYKEKKHDAKIAVYYAQGDIVDQPASGFNASDEPQIVGSKVVEDLDELANDDDVKAVVLRINSGGGSAYASEQMWHAVQLLKKKKPVVVSMSGMAASGGYYLACGANLIVAEPATLTGSIGIFGMVPDVSGLLTEKLGLHFDMVKTNASSDFGTLARPFNPAEAAAMQGFVDRGYRLFLSRVAEGRHMKVEDVDKIAQGRVWTGNQAKGLKLVDRLGTLDDAVAEAARLAKVKEYAVKPCPAKPSWMDNLMGNLDGSDYLEENLRLALGQYYSPLRFVATSASHSPLQARIFFVPNFK